MGRCLKSIFVLFNLVIALMGTNIQVSIALVSAIVLIVAHFSSVAKGAKK